MRANIAIAVAAVLLAVLALGLRWNDQRAERDQTDELVCRLDPTDC